MRKGCWLMLLFLVFNFNVWSVEEAPPLGINTLGWEGSMTISADGQEIIFAYKPKDPVFAAYGYDKSGPDRPGNNGNNFDLYSATKQADGAWSEPVNLKTINTIKPEYSPSLTADGKMLLFAREDHVDKPNIYFSNRTPAGWSSPQPFPAPFNSSYGEDSPYQLPDGSAIIFATRRIKFTRPWELYISEKNEQGFFGEPFILSVNSQDADDLHPAVHPVTGDLYFVSNRGENHQFEVYVAVPDEKDKHYWERTKLLKQEWASDIFMSPAFDSKGQYLYFSYYAKDKTGFMDIYASKLLPDNVWEQPIPITEIKP